MHLRHGRGRRQRDLLHGTRTRRSAAGRAGGWASFRRRLQQSRGGDLGAAEPDSLTHREEPNDAPIKRGASRDDQGSPPSRRPLWSEEADDGSRLRLFADVKFRIGGHLGIVPTDEAPIPEPPAVFRLGHGLASGLDQFSAIVIIAAPGRVPAMGQGGRAEKPARYHEYRPPSATGHPGQAFPEEATPRLTSSSRILARATSRVQSSA